MRRMTEAVVVILLAGSVMTGCTAGKKDIPGGILGAGEKTLAAAIGFDAAVAEEFRRYVSDIRQLDVPDPETGRNKKADGLSGSADSGQAPERVRRLNAVLVPRGYRAFLQVMNFGVDKKSDLIAVVRTRDQFSPLRLCGTAGVSQGIDTGEIIEKLQAWHDRFGIQMIGAGPEWVQFDFVRQPADMMDFAREVAAFCPAVVEPENGTVEALAEEMAWKNTVYLWWEGTAAETENESEENER